jgi:ABC-type transport auxiliary lipoprotein component
MTIPFEGMLHCREAKQNRQSREAKVSIRLDPSQFVMAIHRKALIFREMKSYSCRRLEHCRSGTSIIGLRRWPKWPGGPCPTIWINGCRRVASFIRDCPSQSCVNVDILEFNIAASQASMRASWVIVPSGDAQGAKRSVASLCSSMSSGEPAAVAHAWSDLIGQLADRIAANATSFNMP